MPRRLSACRLLTCPGLSVPMLAGLLRPALLLPDRMPAGDALRFSLLHELTHFRRRDIWRKALALWVRAVHWFNPLVWLALRAMDRSEAGSVSSPASHRFASGDAILSRYKFTQSDTSLPPIRPTGDIPPRELHSYET